MIRVLGKGSFGVVRLVREARSSTDDSVGEGKHIPLRLPLKKLATSAKDTLRSISLSRHDAVVQRRPVFAMKVIRKSAMVRNSQEGHLRAERDFLVAAEGSRWVIPLLTAFEDARFLYLVMEFCIGGDFLGLLIRKTLLSEEVTRWYIAEMILCIDEAHRMNWIHRDVKPDNFLIGADGHLKISDFGLAFDGEWHHDQNYFHKHRHSLLERLGIEIKGDEDDQHDATTDKAADRISCLLRGKTSKSHLKKTRFDNEGPENGQNILDWRNRQHRRDLAKSVVGTSQYMAPEVIRGELYDGRCDWWSIGIIMYECLYGYTPFACENRQDTKLRILKHRSTLDFPSPPHDSMPVSFHALDLMMALLVEREERLSSKKYRHNDFVQHMTTLPAGVIGDKNKQDRILRGQFVFANDAEDIKRHKFFRSIPWDELHVRRPPFIPRVKSAEDTKYFEDEGVISDMSDSSDDEGLFKTLRMTGDRQENETVKSKVLVDIGGQERISQHQQEDQKIIPSVGIQPIKVGMHQVAICEETGTARLPNPLLSPDLQMDGTGTLVPRDEGRVTMVDGPAALEQNANDAKMEQRKKRKEMKRPRDKILRDAECAKKAMKMRKRGAFRGYEYIRPRKAASEIIMDVLGELGNGHLGEGRNGVKEGETDSLRGGRVID